MTMAYLPDTEEERLKIDWYVSYLDCNKRYEERTQKRQKEREKFLKK